MDLNLNKPKPIQIRLPQDLEDSLRYAAYKSRTTLNSVVIDCLKEHLPPVSPQDLTVYHGVSPFSQSEEQLFKAAHERLGRYQNAVQLQLDLVLQLASLLNAQASYARNMQRDLQNGLKLKIPDNNDGTMPNMETERGTTSPEILKYLDSSNLLKNEATARKCRKALARHQYDAVGEWEQVKDLLQRLDLTDKTSHDPSAR